MPPVSERVVDELRRLDLRRAPDAAVAVRDSLLGGIEHPGPEDVVQDRVGARWQAFTGTGPALLRPAQQLNVQSFAPRRRSRRGTGRTSADDYDIRDRPCPALGQYCGTHRSAP